MDNENSWILRKRTKRRKEVDYKTSVPEFKISVSWEKIGPTPATPMVPPKTLTPTFVTPLARSTTHKQRSITSSSFLISGIMADSKSQPKKFIPNHTFPVPLPRNVKLHSPCLACEEWPKRRREEVTEEPAPDEDTPNFMILPLAGLFIFLSLLTMKTIAWFHEDIRLEDEKHIQFSPLPHHAISRQPSTLSRTYPQFPPSASVSTCSSPLRGSKHKHYCKSRVTPEREQRDRESVESSLENICILDLRHKRPPALAASSSRGLHIHRDLRRQLSLDKTKPQWGVHYQAKHRDSDSSSGIASGSVVQGLAERHASPKDLSSPSSLGYVSHSDSFQDGAPLLQSSPSSKPPQHFTRRLRTNSDLQLARALLQLQSMSVALGGSLGGMSADGGQSVLTMSTGTSSNTLPSPNIQSRASGSEHGLSLTDSAIASPSGFNEGDNNSQDNEDYITNLTTQMCNGGLGSNSSLACSDYLHPTDTNDYFEDPFILASPYVEQDTFIPAVTQTMISPDSNANVSGPSSKHSSIYEYVNAQSPDSPRNVRHGQENMAGSKSSFWNSSMDSVQGMSVVSSTSSDVSGSMTPSVFYTIACVHEPPTSTTGSINSVHSKDANVFIHLSTEQMKSMKSVSPKRTFPSPANSFHRRKGSQDLLRRIGKFARDSLGHHSKMKRQSRKSWCIADTIKANLQDSPSQCRHSLVDNETFL